MKILVKRDTFFGVQNSVYFHRQIQEGSMRTKPLQVIIPLELGIQGFAF